ncbi:MAG: response regulator [Coriobacteriales bacterium]|nr:response regulator [Coriobacteriales bacterium]
MNVLIVDDERLIVEDLARDVKTLYPNAVVDGVTSVHDALTLVQETSYDVALLDIDMPGMDGFALAKKLAQDCPTINIVFVTGHPDYALDAHELYCSAFLVKPIGVRKLRRAFQNLRRPFVDLPQDFSKEHYSGGDVLGKRLEACREQRGMSRKELAELMDVTRQTVFRWEQGERVPDVLTFVRLARVLGVRVEDLMGSLEQWQ